MQRMQGQEVVDRTGFEPGRPVFQAAETRWVPDESSGGGVYQTWH